MAALREVAGAGGERRLDGGVGGDPVCEGVFTVLDDAVEGCDVSGCFGREGSNEADNEVTYALLAS